MATLRQDLGPVTAYAYAVSEGYTGTEEEFAEVLANFADSAEQVAADAAQVALDKGAVHDDKEAVDSAEGRVTSAVNTFTTTTAPNAATAVENAGATQIGLVEAEGTRQIGLVADKGTEQVGTVSSEGTTQIGLVEAKGAEVIASIPGDYSTLQGDIASTYSSSSTYAVGDYVLYSGQLYRCTTAISTAEAWTSAKWTAVSLGDDVTDLKSVLYNTTDSLIGTWNVSSASKSFTNITKGLYIIDATQLTSGECIKTLSREVSGGVFMPENMVKRGQKTYIYLPKPVYQLYLNIIPSQQSYSGTVTLSKVTNYNEHQIPVATMPTTKNGRLPISDDIATINKMWGNGGAISGGGKIAVGLFNVTGEFEISLTNYTNYKFSVVTYDINYQTYILGDTGYITSGSYITKTNYNTVFGITLSRVTGNITNISELNDAGLIVSPIGIYYDKHTTISSLESCKLLLENKFTDNVNLAIFTGRFAPMYDHLFVSRTGNGIVIPHQSLYHVRISRKMGFNTIEANVAKTSDSVYIVNHLSDGKFGQYFHHVDGTTDISNISVSSVTWQWIKENVRYNSTIPKYRTIPCTLEEFLRECRQQNIMPLVTASDTDVIAIVDKIMGVGNYIAYQGNRSVSPHAIIYHWKSNLTTKEDILQYCKTIGKPFIYGLGNLSDFVDSDLIDLVNTLHDNGFWLGTSYADSKWYKYSYMGFDFNGTQGQTNRINNGNLHNLDSIFGFGDFVITDGTEADGVVTFSANGTISPNIPDSTESAVRIDFEIWFNGSITVPTIGEYGTQVIESDGSIPYFFCTPILNGSPKLTIQCDAETIVYDIKYKASLI